MILQQIAQATRLRVERQKQICSLETIKEMAMAKEKGTPDFELALKSPGVSFICEIKKASPSKGLISPDFPYLSIAKDYREAGASAISVLTEPEFFLGADRYLTEIHSQVSLPLLRKDFTLDPYHIYEAKVLGASAVLLICALLDTDTLYQYLQLCDQLGLSALVETHTEQEVISAKEAGATIIGVNNRNLKTFQVDFQNAIHLRHLVSPNTLFVAESGIKHPDDISQLMAAGVDAVLIGETFMRATNRVEQIREFVAAGTF